MCPFINDVFLRAEFLIFTKSHLLVFFLFIVECFQRPKESSPSPTVMKIFCICLLRPRVFRFYVYTSASSWNSFPHTVWSRGWDSVCVLSSSESDILFGLTKGNSLWDCYWKDSSLTTWKLTCFISKQAASEYLVTLFYDYLSHAGPKVWHASHEVPLCNT